MKESKEKKSKLYIVGIIIFILGVIALVFKAFSLEWIDTLGVLHEKFYLVPIGYSLMGIGFLWTILALAFRKSSNDNELVEP